MCSVEVIKKMNEVSSKIMNLYMSRFTIEQGQTLASLRDITGKAVDPSKKKMSDEEKNNVFDAYRGILVLVLMNTEDAIKKSKIYFTSLQDVMTGYPYFNKKKMDEKTKELYDDAFSVLKNRDIEASSDLISCTQALFS